MIDVMLSVVAPTRVIKSFQLTQGTVTAGEYSVWLTSLLRLLEFLKERKKAGVVH
jgi:hypothetical protein